MAAFQELDWSRIDVCAIVASAGLAAVDERRSKACISWLEKYGYAIDLLDCSDGLNSAILALANLLDWQGQFGYSLEPSNRNLDALRDGFSYLEASDGGRVLVITASEKGWEEDSRWFSGLLSIAQNHSREQLALGRRFFTLLVVTNKASPLIGQPLEQNTVPALFWNPSLEMNEFLR